MALCQPLPRSLPVPILDLSRLQATRSDQFMFSVPRGFLQKIKPRQQGSRSRKYGVRIFSPLISSG